MPPEAKTISDQVIDELYMTPERKRVPEVHLESFAGSPKRTSSGPEPDQLPIPSQRTIYREIAAPITLRGHGGALRQTPRRDGIQGVGHGARNHPRSPAGVDGSHAQRPHRRGRQQHVAAGPADDHLGARRAHALSDGLLRWIRTAELLVRDEVPQTRDSPQDLCPARVSVGQEPLGMLWRAGTRGGR